MPEREIASKQRRLAQFLERHALHGVLLQQRPNFAWITAGRDNRLAGSTPAGFAAILATADSRVCLADTIEAPRLREEELKGTGIEVIEFPWWDPAAGGTKVLEVMQGRRIAADADPLGLGLRPMPPDFAELRWSLTADEITRYRAGAARALAGMEEACRALDFGKTEQEIAGTLDYCIRLNGCTPLSTLVTSDERIERPRQTALIDQKAERYVMLVTRALYGGLVSSLTRFVSFGPVTAEVAAKVQACANVDAAVNLATRPGRTLGELFGVLQRAYAENGYDRQWEKHHQGGPTGYASREAVPVPTSRTEARANQAFAWKASITGVRSEDTVLCTAEGVEVLTAPSATWPTVTGRSADGELPRADILIR